MLIFRKDLEITKRKAENVASKSPEDLKEPFHTKVGLISNLTYGKDKSNIVMKLERRKCKRKQGPQNHLSSANGFPIKF